MPRIAVVGLGLIGGSLALALADAHEVVGVEPDATSRALAEQAGLRVVASAPEALAGAALAVLCVPLGALPQALVALAPCVEVGTVVTDVGGVKAQIVAMGRRHLPDGAFVGGHPLAGSVGQGFAAADRGLFRQARWALTPESEAERQAADRIEKLLEPTGARFVRLDPATHDRAVAFTSHVPYLAALALARAAQSATKEGLPAVTDVVGPGFRDMTRLALTPPDLAQAMAIENDDAVMLGLAALRYQFAQLEILIQNRMHGELRALAQGVADWREKL